MGKSEEDIRGGSSFPEPLNVPGVTVLDKPEPRRKKQSGTALVLVIAAMHNKVVIPNARVLLVACGVRV